MQVFKFGGASVKDPEAVRNVASVIQQYSDKSLVVVVSAMGKITNALEVLTHHYMDRAEEPMMEKFLEIKNFHLQIAGDLLTIPSTRRFFI